VTIRHHGEHDDIALFKVRSSCIGKKGHLLLNSARATNAPIFVRETPKVGLGLSISISRKGNNARKLSHFLII
jgi:hypothetical protein